MPAPETDYRFQCCVFWERIGDDAYGHPLLSSPIELRVRWENVQVEFLTPDGQPIKVDALVIVTRDIPVGSILWLGRLSDLEDQQTNITNLMLCIGMDNIPDIKGRVFRRTARMKRYTDNLPTVSS